MRSLLPHDRVERGRRVGRRGFGSRLRTRLETSRSAPSGPPPSTHAVYFARELFRALRGAALKSRDCRAIPRSGARPG